MAASNAGWGPLLNSAISLNREADAAATRALADKQCAVLKRSNRGDDEVMVAVRETWAPVTVGRVCSHLHPSGPQNRESKAWKSWMDAASLAGKELRTFWQWRLGCLRIPGAAQRTFKKTSWDSLEQAVRDFWRADSCWRCGSGADSLKHRLFDCAANVAWRERLLGRMQRVNSPLVSWDELIRRYAKDATVFSRGDWCWSADGEAGLARWKLWTEAAFQRILSMSTEDWQEAHRRDKRVKAARAVPGVPKTSFREEFDQGVLDRSGSRAKRAREDSDGADAEAAKKRAL